MRSTLWHRLIGFSWILLLAPGTLGATEPMDRLLQLVGSDVGICIEIPELQEQVPKLIDGPFFTRLRNWESYRQWQSKYQPRWRRMQAALEKLAQKPARQIGQELFGEAVVLAIYPTSQDETAGVLLLNTANADALESAVQLWNRSPSLEIETRTHSGQAYFRRARPIRGNRTPKVQYFVTLGRVFALSDDETMIRNVIDFSQATGSDDHGATGSLWNSSSYREARNALSQQTLVSIYINPDAWAPWISSKFQTLSRIWPLLKSIAVGIRLDQGLLLEAVAHYHQNDVPKFWTNFITGSQGAADFLNQIPENALVAGAGTQNLNILGMFLTRNLSELGWPRGRRALEILEGLQLLSGTDLIQEILPAEASHWTFYLVSRSPDAEKALPVDGLFAIELPASAAGRQPVASPIERWPRLDRVLNLGWNFLAAHHNSQAAETDAAVQTQQETNRTIRWIEDLNSFQPTYVLTDDRLVLASERKLASDFAAGYTQRVLADLPIVQQTRSRFFSDANQILFINVLALREFFSQNRAFFPSQDRPQTAEESQKTGERFSRLLRWMQPFDAAFATASVQENRLRIFLGAIVNPSSADEHKTE